MNSPAYHNTTPLAGDQLSIAFAVAEHQDAVVLRIMADGLSRTPSQVWQLGQQAGKKWLLTSVRRSMTNLEHNGALLKLDQQRDGLYGRPERVWVKA